MRPRKKRDKGPRAAARIAVVISALAAGTSAADAGEPGGFRPGLYFGEVATGAFVSAPVVVGGLYVLAISNATGAEGSG